MANTKMIKKDKRYKDVTREYFSEATPGRGNVDEEKNYSKEKHKDETYIAKMIHRELGGDILLINEVLSSEGEKSPDFMWNESLWDLKSPVSIKPFTKRIRKGIHQIKKNPGGIIVVLPDTISIEKATDIIWKRWQTTGKKITASLDVIIIRNDRICKVIRFGR